MFPEPIKWTNDASSEGRPATPRPAALDFAMAYEAAIEEIADSKAWLDMGTGVQVVPSLAADLTGLSSSQYQPVQPVQPVQTVPSVPFSDDLPSAPSVLDKTQLADWMDSHALARSSHRCAMYCRQGMEAAGLTTSDRPRSGDAADYGPFLLHHGAQVVAPAGYTPQVGDTVVFDRTERHPNGHIEIYDGRQWVSDFLQHSFSPYSDAGNTLSFTIYRLS